MKIDLSRYAPPGFDLTFEKKFFQYGLIVACLYSLRFMVAYQEILSHLDVGSYYGLSYVLPQRMPYFVTLSDSCLAGFAVLAMCMATFCVYHYIYYFQGSKSIYLMRRLPNRWELHRRNLTIPAVCIAICVIAGFLVLMIYLGIYLLYTPDECMQSGQWQVFLQYCKVTNWLF